MKGLIQNVVCAALIVGCGCAGLPCHTSKAPRPDSASPSYSMRTNLSHFKVLEFEGAEHESAPAVLLLHEITGVSPACIEFASKLSDSGFRVYVPVLFGSEGQHGKWVSLKTFAKVLFSPDWHLLRGGRTPRIADPIQQLCNSISTETGGKKIGVIGMCLSGSLPLALVDSKVVGAVALCQPTVPYPAWTEGRKNDLGLLEADVSEAVQAIKKDRIPVFVTRFACDPKSKSERLNHLSKQIGDEELFSNETIPCDELPEQFRKRPHSVFCSEFTWETHATNERFTNLVTVFREALTK